MARPYPQIILLGDSLFQQSSQTINGFSFQSTLQSDVIRAFDVVNRGFSGWNTSNVVKYLPQIISSPSSGAKIEYLLVLLGANDAVRDVPGGIQHVPIDKYKENLKTIITHPSITEHGCKIFLVTPPPLNEIRIRKDDLANGVQEPLRTFKVSAEYSAVAREVAAETPGVVLIDLWQALVDKAIALTPGFKEGDPLPGSFESRSEGGLGQLLSDGLHMSGDGYRVFYGLIAPLLEHHWAPYLVNEERLHYVLPDWKKINPPDYTDSE